MVKIVLTSNLQKYFPKKELELEANTLFELLQKMDQIRDLFSTYIIDEQKSIRHHVNIFINGSLYTNKTNLNLNLKNGDTIHIMQALSGG